MASSTKTSRPKRGKNARPAEEPRVNLRLNSDRLTDRYLLGFPPGQRSGVLRRALADFMQRELLLSKFGGTIVEPTVIPVKPVESETETVVSNQLKTEPIEQKAVDSVSVKPDVAKEEPVTPKPVLRLVDPPNDGATNLFGKIQERADQEKAGLEKPARKLNMDSFYE
ncbi:MAG: hypothetical protein ACYDBP_07200 [Leptospirales bacterium]